MHVLRLALLAVAACSFFSSAAASDETDAISAQIEELKQSEAQLVLLRAALEAREATLEIKSFAATADSGSGSSSQSVDVPADDAANSEFAVEPLPTAPPKASESASSSGGSEPSASSASSSPASGSGSAAVDEVVATPTPTPSSGASSLAAPTAAALTSAVVYALL